MLNNYMLLIVIIERTKQLRIMEKKIFAVLLTLLGIGGLIYAAVVFAQSGGFKSIIIYGVLGAIFFFAGIGIMRSLRDVRNKNEEAA